MATKIISTVSVPTTTLNALKGLLFSKDGGVDLTTIISDLTTADCESADLMAINVGLAFKGLKPEIDKTTRFGSDYKNLIQYDFVSYSLILDKVSIHRKIVAKWSEEKGDLCPCNDDKGYDISFSLQDWYNKETDRQLAVTTLVNRFAPKPQQ